MLRDRFLVASPLLSRRESDASVRLFAAMSDSHSGKTPVFWPPKFCPPREPLILVGGQAEILRPVGFAA